MTERSFEHFEQSLRARWYSQPALALDEVKARWGPGRWPSIIRYRVISRPGSDGRDHLVSHVGPSLADARRYAASLRALGVGRPGPLQYRDLHILRSKLGPSHVLVATRIPVLMRHHEPPHVVLMIGLLYSPSGRIKAYYQDGQQRRFESLRGCLAFYHRDVAWLARREAYHLRAQ